MLQEANLSAMTEAQTALAELTEISSQIEGAVLFDREGAVAGSTVSDERAVRIISAAKALLEAAEQVRDAELTQVEAATGEGSLFVVRDGAQLIAATTGTEPTAGLVFYDLKSCLRKASEKPKPKRRAAARRPRAKSSGPS
jgi:predicted regulator of Ras-like GTPase activity (Roadblock/LC7/MglB family)